MLHTMPKTTTHNHAHASKLRPTSSRPTTAASYISSRHTLERYITAESHEREHDPSWEEGEDELDLNADDVCDVGTETPAVRKQRPKYWKPSLPKPPPISSTGPPLTVQDAFSPTVLTLGIGSIMGKSDGSRPLILTREHLVSARSQQVDGCENDEAGPEKTMRRKRMTVSEAAWKRWEEVGGLAKGAEGVQAYAYAYDQQGDRMFTRPQPSGHG